MDSDQQVMLSVEQVIFLKVLSQLIHDKPIMISEEEIRNNADRIVYLSSAHMVLSLVVNGLYQSFPDLVEKYKERAIQRTILQAEKTASFVDLYKKMITHGLNPVVLKGIICRNLYPEPELRPSTDEDLLISSDSFDLLHSFLLQNGFVLSNPETSLSEEYEVSYINPNTHLYLEIHKSLFPISDKTYGYLNTAFENMEPFVTISIYGLKFKTLGYTDHLLYLLLHAYKHLIYSGIGIRQICDIVLFIEQYHDLINWNRVTNICDELNLNKFLHAVIGICEKHLGMPSLVLMIPEENVDEEPLLYDILSGGVYGANDVNRLHSATMTLRAIEADKQGKNSNGIIKALFPSIGYMKKSFPYLKKRPYLLPVAWVNRICRYAFLTNSTSDASKTVDIGKERIKMLRNYNIIK